MVLSRYITSLVMHQAQQNGAIQFKTTLRTVGAGTFEPWHTFSKSYLVIQHSGICQFSWPCSLESLTVLQKEIKSLVYM